jgi:hypothetical protein
VSDVEFEEVQDPSWMTRTTACRYFGLTDDDEGWDRLNEIVDEFDIDCELGPIGDVLRVNANDPGVQEALFTKHEREVGHRPDHPERVAEARRQSVADRKAMRAHRQTERKAKLAKRIAKRKGMTKGRLEE